MYKYGNFIKACSLEVNKKEQHQVLSPIVISKMIIWLDAIKRQQATAICNEYHRDIFKVHNGAVSIETLLNCEDF